VLQALDDDVRADPPEVEPLQPRQNGCGGLRDLLRLGGREHEHHAWRRLLENLEQRVPRLAREHVGFVDDVDLGARLGARGVHGALTQVTRVVHATVRRSVELDDVEVRGAAPNPGTGFAAAARLPRRAAPLAIQCHREDSRGGGLPHAARPGKEIAVRDAILRDGATERRRDVILRDEIRELAGTVLASEGDHDRANDVTK